MKPGTRIIVNGSSPWPERVGCDGVIVAPYEDGSYPQPAKWEVIVLLDADPLGYPGHDPQWSCVLDRKSVDRAHVRFEAPRSAQEGLR